MSSSGRRTVDRTVLVVQALHDQPDERQWWWARTPHERLAAIETMRRVVLDGLQLTDDFD